MWWRCGYRPVIPALRRRSRLSSPNSKANQATKQVSRGYSKILSQRGMRGGQVLERWLSSKAGSSAFGCSSWGGGGSIASTHMVVYYCRPVTPLRGGSNALFWPLGVRHTGCAQTYTQAKHLYTWNQIFKKHVLRQRLQVCPFLSRNLHRPGTSATRTLQHLPCNSQVRWYGVIWHEKSVLNSIF